MTEFKVCGSPCDYSDEYATKVVLKKKVLDYVWNQKFKK